MAQVSMDAMFKEIVSQGQKQLVQQPRLSPTDADSFFSVMRELWELSDKHDIKLDFTSFVVLGQQSAGKSSLMERLVGFVLGCVRDGRASRRPLVITTTRQDEESIEVWDDEKKHGFVTRSKMYQLLLQMNEDTDGAEFSPRRIYVRVSGPKLANMRLVDLPGYEINSACQEFLKKILMEELADPNTIILALGTPDVYANQVVLQALRECNVKDDSDRVLHCLHCGDKIWNKQRMPDSFANYLYPFVNGIGRIPLIVGNTAKLQSNGEPYRRLAEVADVSALSPEERDSLLSEDDVNAHLEEADDVERGSINSWYQAMLKSAGANADIVKFLKDHFMGRANLTGVVSGMVLRRDRDKLPVIKEKLRAQISQINDTVKLLEGTKASLENPEIMLGDFVVQLINNLREVMYPDSGNANVAVVEDLSVIDDYGMTLEEEEDDFQLNGGWNPETDLAARDMYYTYQTVFKPPPDTIERFVNFITNAEVPPVDLHDAKMFAGAAFTRVQASWSAHMYKFNRPNPKEDPNKLINLFGSDPEMQHENIARRATRLAHLYCNRLHPAVHYYIHRVQWLMGRMFDVNWKLVARDPEMKPLVDLIGDYRLHDAMRAAFMEELRQLGKGTYQMVLDDLYSEIMKLFPFQTSSPARVGLRAALPQESVALDRRLEQDAEVLRKHYESDAGQSKGKVKKIRKFFSDVADGLSFFDQGAFKAISMLQTGSSSTLGAIAEMLLDTLRPNELKEASTDPRTNLTDAAIQFNHDVKEVTFGFACALYANCLPRFITTVNSRLTANLWGCAKNKKIITALKASVADDVKQLHLKKQFYDGLISKENDKLAAIEAALKKIDSIAESQPSTSTLSSGAANCSGAPNYSGASSTPAASGQRRFAEKVRAAAAAKKAAHGAKKGPASAASTMEKLLRACWGAKLTNATDEELRGLAETLTDFRSAYKDAFVQEEKGDGNCFYRAVARQVAGSAEAWQLIKRGALAQMKLRGEDYADELDNVTMEEYIAEHSADGVWADRAIMIATAYFLGCEIEVFPLRYTEGEKYGIGPKSNKRPVRLISWTGQHFDSFLQDKKACPVLVKEQTVASFEAKAKKTQEEAAKKKKAEEAAKTKKAEEEAAKKKKAEEEATKKKKAEEEAAKKKKAEEEAAKKKKAEEEAAKKKKAEEEAAKKKKAEEEAAKKKKAEEEAKKKTEEEAVQKKAEEEAAQKKKADTKKEAAQKKKANKGAQKKKAEGESAQN